MLSQHWPGFVKPNMMRVNMSMTNAQAALIAASNAAVRGSAVPLEPVLKRAAAYLQWLEAQDEPEAEPESEPVRRVIVQCEAVSLHGIHCLLAGGHEGPHSNSHEGAHWDDIPAVTVRVTHFVTEPGAAYTVCGRITGRTEEGYRRITTLVSDVTCDTCKEALGL